MSHMAIHENLKIVICYEWMATMTKIENIMFNLYEDNCLYKKFCSKVPKYSKYTRDLGKTGVVISIMRVNFKIKYWGTMCMFWGYEWHHMSSTYHMLNVCTKNGVLRCELI